MRRIYLARVLAVLAMLTAISAAADEFVRAGYMHSRRFGHTSTLLSDGRVLITGGEPDNHTGVLSSAEIYDPSTHTFTTTGSMHRSRVYHQAALLHDGTVLVVGGLDIFTDPPPPAEIYDPSTGTFTDVGRPVSGRYNAIISVLPSGKVLIAGGFGCCHYFSNGGEVSTGLATAEVYDPDTQSFSAVSPMTDDRGPAAWAQLSTGAVLIVGGAYTVYDGDNIVGEVFLKTADLFDPSTLEFSRTSGSMSVGRIGQVAATLPDGKVLVAYGGVDPDGNELPPSAELYDPSTDQFVAAADPPDNKTYAPTVVMSDGRVLAVAGDDIFTGIFSDTADLYDPVQDTFTTTTATMSTIRDTHRATALEDGTVLITGGIGLYHVPLIGGELFVPSAAVVDAMFSDGFDASDSGGSIPAADVSAPSASLSVCADASALPLSMRGIVQVVRLPDGTQCIRQ